MDNASCAQGLLFSLWSGVTPGGTQGQYVMIEIELCSWLHARKVPQQGLSGLWSIGFKIIRFNWFLTVIVEKAKVWHLAFYLQFIFFNTICFIFQKAFFWREKGFWATNYWFLKPFDSKLMSCFQWCLSRHVMLAINWDWPDVRDTLHTSISQFKYFNTVLFLHFICSKF